MTGSVPSRTSSGTYCHFSLPGSRSSSECCTQMTGVCSARARSTRDLMVAITSSRRGAGHHSVLHVDDEQCAVRPVGEGGHEQLLEGCGLGDATTLGAPTDRPEVWR